MGKTAAATKEPPKFLRVADVAAMLDISESHAYKIMRQLNKELEAKGKSNSRPSIQEVPGRKDVLMADNTWRFLEHQESNPEALKQAVDTLIGYTKKKGFAGAENAQLDNLELVKHVIICEAAALVLSDDWQAFMKYRKAGGKEDGENKRN